MPVWKRELQGADQSRSGSRQPRPPPCSTSAVVFTDGATSPGNHDLSDAITVSGYLIPGRRFYVWHVGHSYRSVFLFRRLARDRAPLIFHRDVGASYRPVAEEKSICDPCIRPAIMMVKPTPIATPNMPTRVCRTRVLTWVHANAQQEVCCHGLTGSRCIYRRSCVRR